MDPSPPAPRASPAEPAAGASHLLSATLHCDTCGRETPHRILRIVARKAERPGELRGIARCRECRWTHPFEVTGPETVEVAQIVSEGPRSVRTRIVLPRFRRIQVGSGVPDAPESRIVHRIETRDGGSPSEAPAYEIATLWVTRNVGAVVPVSLVEGARTRTFRTTWPPEADLEVGRRVTVEGASVVIVGLRAVGHTWRRPGDRFRALEVQRIYARRTEIPPAGRRDWSRGRAIPSSRTSSTSRSARSRSSPGVSTTRTVPRRRTAAAGAAVHRLSPS